jgi:hypothetical protein
VVVLLLPGAGFGELLGAWRKGDSLIERLGMAIGLGITVDTAIVLVTGLSIQGGVPMISVSDTALYAALGAGAVALVCSAVIKKKFSFVVRPTVWDGLVFAFMAVQGILFTLFFQKYPIFPEYLVPDTGVHAGIVQSLVTGRVDLSSAVLYYGAHFQLSLSYLLVGGDLLIEVQRGMALLAVIATPVFFLAASRFFSSRRAGLTFAMLYTLGGTIWFIGVLNASLYANFFGLIACAFLLVAVAEAAERRSKGTWVILALAALTMYFSHYSSVTLVPALLLYPVVQRFFKKFERSQVYAILVILVPAVVGVLVYRYALTLLLYFVSNTGGATIGQTYLSGLLSVFPVLSAMVLEVNYDIGFVLLAVLAGFGTWKAVKTKSALGIMLLIWLVCIMVVSPLNIGAWRYAYVGLLPLLLLASYGLASVLPIPQKGMKVRFGGKQVLFAFLVISLLIGAWGVMVVSDATSGTQVFSQAQYQVYDSIQWLGQNTPANSSYLSVSDWRYSYTDLLIQRTTTYEFTSTPSQAIPLAESLHSRYIIVTDLVTASVTSADQFPWNNFPTHSDANLTLIYSNPDVRIFSVNSTSGS